MKKEVSVNYYLSRQERLLGDFDGFSRVMGGVLAEYRGREFADTMFARARAEFMDILPTLPYIGGEENFLTADLVEGSLILAWYKALAREKVGLKEITRLVHETFRRRLNRYPRVVRYLTGRFRESRWFIRRRAGQAVASQERRYPGDWVFSFVRGDGKDLLYGTDYTECGICKLYRAHGAQAAVPINCGVDFIMARAFGLKMKRTTSLGTGGTVCNFRYMRR